MAALTAERAILVATRSIRRATFPLKAGSKAFANGLACYDTASAGTVTQGATSTTLIPIGRFLSSFDNTAGGSSVPIGVMLDREHLVSYWDSVTGGGAITIANLFQTVFITTDHEFTTVSTGASKGGIVWDVSPAGYPGGIGIEMFDRGNP